YGPGMRIRDARQTFVGVWLRAVLEGRPFELWGGEQKRDFTYVEDAVNAFLLAAARPATEGGVYNIGGDGEGEPKKRAEGAGGAGGRARRRPICRQGIPVGAKGDRHR